MELTDKRLSTPGYSAPNLPPGYVRCLEQHTYPADGVILEDHTAIITITDDNQSTLSSGIKHAQEKPNDFLELTLVACLFNFIFAIVAMSLSYKSRDSWKLGDRLKASGYGIASMAVSVFAIITTGMIVFVLIWLYVLRGSPQCVA